MSFHDYHLSYEGKAALVSLISPHFAGHTTESETKESLEELKDLITTLGLSYTQDYIQKKEKPNAGTILGKGKLLEIAKAAKDDDCHTLVFDFELTASQIRNIKKITGLEVIDRCNVILEIFAQHAKTNAAKIQIEISRLEYLLPRLTSYWSHFSRQKGGVGLKGEGEQQLELDRRMIRKQIQSYKQQLTTIKKSRKEQAKKRQQKVIKIALVGYTNAGKSSLMNRLCQEEVLEEDKLFATLDTTVRCLTPQSQPPIVMIDTVGFLSNLPNTLITGFKTTLESALEADLLVIVCDVSHPQYQKHLEVTENVLSELGITDKEKMIVFNKSDLLKGPFEGGLKSRNYQDSFVVSTLNDQHMKDLRKSMIDFFLDKQQAYDLFVDYSLGNIHAKIKGQTNIIKTHHYEKGIHYHIKVPQFLFASLGLNKYCLKPTDWELNPLPDAL